MNKYDINLDKYKKLIRKEYKFLSTDEADELTEELYSFLERWYLLEIEGEDI